MDKNNNWMAAVGHCKYTRVILDMRQDANIDLIIEKTLHHLLGVSDGHR